MSNGPRTIEAPQGQCEASNVSAIGYHFNPLGTMKDTITTLTLQTGYKEFRSPDPLGIGGLCQLKPGHVDILAVHSEHQGEGNFSVFLEALEPLAGTVTFWSMMSEHLGRVLNRRGYKTIMLKDKFGQTHRCMSKTLWKDEAHAGLQAGDSDGSQSPVAFGDEKGVAVGYLRPTGGT